MASLEQIAELNTLHKPEAAEKSKRSINFYVYFPENAKFDSKELSDVLERINKRFKQTFDLSFNYVFLQLPKLKSTNEKFAEYIRAFLKEQKKDNISGKEDELLEELKKRVGRYNTESPVQQLFRDFYHSADISGINYAERIVPNDGLHCILCFDSLTENEKVKSHIAGGVSAVGQPYMVIRFLEDKDFFEQIILHETSHCFGAGHSNSLFSLMCEYSENSSPRWDSNSKHLIQLGIEIYFNGSKK